jgi:hypothetical protein
MSWSISAEGTKQEAKDAASKQLDQSAANYQGCPEADDIAACKARIVALIDAMQVDDGKKISVSANGSHSWQSDKTHPLSATFTVRLSVV